MSDGDSSIDEVLGSVEAALNARRAPLIERVRRVARALEDYRQAVEAQIARQFASEHRLPLPAATPLSPERAAEILETLVRELPERAREQARADAAVDSPPSGSIPPSAPASTGAAERYPSLTAAARHAKIVAIGALAGRDRSPSVPDELAGSVEWIDTEREGAHAIGNLPQRVRQGRVAGVIILDRVVSHRHTEPVVAAARDAGVPVAFAGQGGKASLVRALERLEAALSGRE